MYFPLKRFMDFFISLIAIIILLPVFIIISILIKIESRGDVFFKQKRIGKNKKHFTILKFRTMYTETPKDVPTHLLENPEIYITKMGKFLRKTSLDELPQIFNIFKGEMSIVGPRPALWNQFDLIKLRDLNGSNKLLPGITGLAQVMGRDELSVKVKSKYDGIYKKRISFDLDLWIFRKTIISVIKKEGILEGSKKMSR